jgi:uncharacterized protein
MIRLVRLFIGVLVLLGLAASLGKAETLPSKPAGYFNDYAGVLDRATVERLNEKLAQFERETSTQLLVAIYRTMQSESSVSDYTQRVAKTWGVGQQGRNNGAVLFVFVENRQMFIQTGYGLEGALPDATCFDITHNIIAPRFKAGDYPGGLEAGVNAMMQAVRGEYKGSGRTKAEGAKDIGPQIPFGIVLLVFIIIIFVMSRTQKKGRRGGYGYSGWGGPYVGGFGSGSSGSGWSSGSSGGGFSGFSGGGGSFGGGGAGSSW